MILPAPFTNNGKHINVVIETPRGNSNKFTYIPENDFFKITKVLPAGLVFPWDFGFIPGTKGDDGDPLDVLVLMGLGAFTGCIIECRLAGAITAIQTEDDKPERNDRIIAISTEHDAYSHIKTIDDINKTMLDEVAGFFTYYNQADGKKFQVTGKKGPDKTRAIIEAQLVKKKQSTIPHQ